MHTHTHIVMSETSSWYRYVCCCRQQYLFHILAAYSMHNTDVGYCQGMSEMAALLLIYLKHEEVSYPVTESLGVFGNFLTFKTFSVEGEEWTSTPYLSFKEMHFACLINVYSSIDLNQGKSLRVRTCILLLFSILIAHVLTCTCMHFFSLILKVGLLTEIINVFNFQRNPVNENFLPHANTKGWICPAGTKIWPQKWFYRVGHISVNDWNTLTEKLAIRFQWNFTHVLMGRWRGLIENFFTFTDDLDLSRSQPCKITFWTISRFLLDKLSPSCNTEYIYLGSGPFNKLKNVLSAFNVRCTRTIVHFVNKIKYFHTKNW